MIDAYIGVHAFLRTRLFIDNIHPGETFEIENSPFAFPKLAVIKWITQVHRMSMNISFGGKLLNGTVFGYLDA